MTATENSATLGPILPPSLDGLTMQQVEGCLRDWGMTQPGLLSFKIARVRGERICRVALDVIDEDARDQVHTAFCKFERSLLAQIDFDLEWMTFSLNEYPVQRRAFFDGCQQPTIREGLSDETQVPDVVFAHRLSAELLEPWARLVRG